MSPGKVLGSMTIELADIEAAIAREEALVAGGSLGPYNKITNSCVSTVCDLLNAGAADGVPAASGSAQLKFLLRLEQTTK